MNNTQNFTQNNTKNTLNKGVKMAFPFLAGVVVGSLAVYAFKNRQCIQNSVVNGLKRGKELALGAKNDSISKLGAKKRGRRTKASANMAEEMVKTSENVLKENVVKKRRGRQKKQNSNPQTAQI